MKTFLCPAAQLIAHRAAAHGVGSDDMAELVHAHWSKCDSCGDFGEEIHDQMFEPRFR